ncbi:MAG: acetate--CoA ligase family protein [Bacillota bacterium]
MDVKVPAGLAAVFYPRRVAVIGVNESPDRVGFNVFQSILDGGFKGPVYPVHPRHETVLGQRVYRSIDELPEPVDVAVICLNQHATVEAVENCGRRGVRGVICHAGGYREMGPEGRALEERLAGVAGQYGMFLVGPNSLGLINTDGDFYSTFYPLQLPRGKVSLISQSGGMGLTIMHRAIDEGVGLNKFVGVGNCSSLGFADYLEYFGEDSGTSVIAVFMEGTGDARRFVQAAGKVSAKKPVVVFKAGRSAVSDHCAGTHTGSAAGSFSLYRDIFKQFGIFTADSVDELVAACKALALLAPPRGNRVGVITHTAGPSIVMADHLSARGCEIPPLKDETLARVRKIIGEDPPVVLKNPLDTAGLGFARQTYGRLTEAVLEDSGLDLLVTVYCLHRNWGLPSAEIVRAYRKHKKPVVACYASHWEGCREDRAYLQEAGVPLYTTPEEAATAVAALVHYAKLNNIYA